MRQAGLNTALVVVFTLSIAGTAYARGSGSGHGSGHGSGGHAGGGHGGGGHSSGGHASGGHGHAGGRASRGSTGSSGGHGVPRGTSGAGAAGSAPATAAATGQSSRRRANGGTVVGTAVPRATSPFAGSRGTYSTFPLFGYSGLGWGYGGLGFLYDPFWPGYGFGYSGYGYAGYPGRAYSSYAYAPDPFGSDGPTGSIRLNVEPRNGEVFVDGYYAGIVDDFDGHLQHLNLAPGPHHIEITEAGYQPLIVDVTIQSRHKIEYRGSLMRSLP